MNIKNFITKIFVVVMFIVDFAFSQYTMFGDDFENNNLNKWDGTIGTIATTSVESYEGTYGVVPGVANSVVYKNFDIGVDSIYVSFYMKPTVLPSSKKAVAVVFYSDAITHDFNNTVARFYIGRSATSYYYDLEENTTSSPTTTNTLSLNSWQKFEIKIFRHSSNGYLKVWRDGVLEVNKTSMNVDNLPMGSIAFGLYAYDSGSLTAYFDSLKVIDLRRDMNWQYPTKPTTVQTPTNSNFINGLIHAYFFNESGTVVNDYGSDSLDVTFNNSGFWDSDSNNNNVANLTPVDTYYSTSGTKTSNITTEISIIVRHKPLVGNQGRLLIGQAITTGTTVTNADWGLYYQGSLNRLDLCLNVGSGFACRGYEPITGYATGVWQISGFTWSDADDTVRFYIDGDSVMVASNLINGTVSSTAGYNFMVNRAGTSKAADVVIDYALIWNRQLSTAEMKTFSSQVNVYSFFNSGSSSSSIVRRRGNGRKIGAF